jgi:predicted RNA-binding protein with PUA-like domain
VLFRSHPDELQFNPESQYYDPKSPPENPRWSQIKLEPVQELRFLELSVLRAESKLEEMLILRKGNRLSVTPVEKKHYQHILKMAK